MRALVKLHLGPDFGETAQATLARPVTHADTNHHAEIAMSRLKFGAGIVLGGLLVLFALQNTADVELTFIVWSFQSRRFVVIGISFLIGLAIGWMLSATRRQHSPTPPGADSATDT